MSREIKFRAWVNDHWVDWIPTCKTLGAYNASVIDTDGYTFEEDNPFIVEQYTGLKDKNDKEIYEGDVVKLDDLGGVTYVDEPVKIVWEDVAFIMKCTKHNQIITDEYGAPWVIGFMVKGIFEVIGNIHENPELLEDK